MGEGAMRQKIFFIIAMGSLFLIQFMNAQTWERTKRLTWTSGFSFAPKVATDSSNNIHVVWMDNSPGTWEIYYKKSTNGGTSWTTKRITWNSGISLYPEIAVDSGDNIHVVWVEQNFGIKQIYYKRSVDNGMTWTGLKRLTWNTGTSESPAIDVDSSNNVYIVWEDDTSGNDEIYYMKSTDGGVTWASAKRLTWTTGASEKPAIKIDSSNNVYIVWEDNTPGNDEIYLTKSINWGITWTTKRLTYTSGYSWDPAITTDSSSNIHIVWSDITQGYQQIFYKISTNGGANWTTKRLTWSLKNRKHPEIAVDSSNNIHVVREDECTADYEIFYRRSTSGGVSWQATKRITWNSGNSNDPAVANDSSNDIHIVWYDDTPGNSEIYYKKGEQ
jgi:hypothetical protein